MSMIDQTVAIACDYPGCRARTPQFSDDFYRFPTATGWERWVGRRTMDYCPPHAARPKSPNLRRIWPRADSGER